MQPVVILLIAGSAMFIMIGGLSLLSHYYTLNGIKSRTVGDGQYGTARFATQKKLRKPMRASRMNRNAGGRENICRRHRE